VSEAVRALVCRKLRLRDYRNFETLDLELPAAGVAVIGDNGSGKTNLLESIYYLEIFRSFRGSGDEQLVRAGAVAFHIRGWFEDGMTGRSVEVTAAYEPGSRTKRVTVDGVEPDRIGDAIGHARAVIFSPSDLSLVTGSPAERRRFLDIVLSVNVPGYLGALQTYRQTLKQRNAMLRDGAAPELIEAFDPAFIESGARIVHERARWIDRHADGFSRRYASIGDGAGASIAYRPGLRIDHDAALDPERSRETIAAEIERVAQRERDRGMSVIGPHRDDISIVKSMDGHDVGLRDLGSGGQMRTAAVALRLIEAESARLANGSEPIVLLDDVFAELDAGRSVRLLETLEAEGHGQVILTAPKDSDVKLGAVQGAESIARLPRLGIRAGRITERDP
jgi:DNA replication and repair protein RecF